MAIVPGTPGNDQTVSQNNTNAVDVGTGDNRYLVVATIAINTSFVGVAVPSLIQYAGVDMTQLFVGTGDVANGYAVYGLRNQASGSNNLVVNFSTGSFDGAPLIGWQSFSGVHQGSADTDAIRANASDHTFGSSISLTLSPVVSGDYGIVVGFDVDDSAHTPNANTTERFDILVDSYGMCWGNRAIVETSIALGWTGGNEFTGRAFALIPAEEAPAGGRIMSSLAGSGGLAGRGGIAGPGGGLAGKKIIVPEKRLWVPVTRKLFEARA
jgi:hypothetical protein